MYLQERRDILIKYQLKDGGNCPDSDESDVKKREEVYILLNRMDQMKRYLSEKFKVEKAFIHGFEICSPSSINCKHKMQTSG